MHNHVLGTFHQTQRYAEDVLIVVDVSGLDVAFIKDINLVEGQNQVALLAQNKQEFVFH
jgi:hypothetical protein